MVRDWLNRILDEVGGTFLGWFVVVLDGILESGRLCLGRACGGVWFCLEVCLIEFWACDSGVLCWLVMTLDKILNEF